MVFRRSCQQRSRVCRNAVLWGGVEEIVISLLLREDTKTRIEGRAPRARESEKGKEHHVGLEGSDEALPRHGGRGSVDPAAPGPRRSRKLVSLQQRSPQGNQSQDCCEASERRWCREAGEGAGGDWEAPARPAEHGGDLRGGRDERRRRGALRKRGHGGADLLERERGDIFVELLFSGGES